jgi:hypothetical protein
MLTKEEDDQEYLDELNAIEEREALAEHQEAIAQISAHAVQGTTPAANTSYTS